MSRLLSQACFFVWMIKREVLPEEVFFIASFTASAGYGYTGQFNYSADFGLIYYGARFYDSSLGRFTSADSIVPAGVQGYDRYAYLNNNLVKYVDPSRHDPKGNCYDLGQSVTTIPYYLPISRF